MRCSRRQLVDSRMGCIGTESDRQYAFAKGNEMDGLNAFK
jgi:hypothetical protein